MSFFCDVDAAHGFMQNPGCVAEIPREYPCKDNVILERQFRRNDRFFELANGYDREQPGRSFFEQINIPVCRYGFIGFMQCHNVMCYNNTPMKGKMARHITAPLLVTGLARSVFVPRHHEVWQWLLCGRIHSSP